MPNVNKLFRRLSFSRRAEAAAFFARRQAPRDEPVKACSPSCRGRPLKV